MKKILLSKCLITLGLLLFFTLLIPFTAAQASNVEKEKIDSYRLNLKSITLVKGKSFTLKAYNLNENAKVSFKSDDPEVASVSDDGTVTANKVGVSIITVTIKDGTITSTLDCDITVGPPAFSIKLTRSRIILGLDNTDLLRVILKPSNTAEDARFSSYDPSIVSVSSGGRVTAKKLGLTYLFAEIDATNLDGSRKFALCSIIVTTSNDAPILESYFNDHPELNSISESDLSKALEDFFNGKYDGTATSSLANSLDRFLNSKFDLAAAREAALPKLEVTSDNNTK